MLVYKIEIYKQLILFFFIFLELYKIVIKFDPRFENFDSFFFILEFIRNLNFQFFFGAEITFLYFEKVRHF